jgi:hypothetical protein
MCSSPDALHVASPFLGSQVRNISFYLFINILSLHWHILCFLELTTCSKASSAAELNPLARLVEGDKFRQMMRHQNRTLRFGFDYPLVCALLRCTLSIFPGEMKISLEDVALLFGYPMHGRWWGGWSPQVVASGYPGEVRARPANNFTNNHGPTSSWLR